MGPKLPLAVVFALRVVEALMRVVATGGNLGIALDSRLDTGTVNEGDFKDLDRVLGISKEGQTVSRVVGNQMK